jgi:immune inhibitor A
MKQMYKVGSLFGMMLILLMLGACSMQGGNEPDRAVRPAATATPLPSAGNPSGRLKPAPLSTPLASSPLTVTELSTAEQVELVVAPTRDLRDLAMRFNPELGEIPVIVNEITPEYNVGDRLEFWAHNMNSVTDFTVTAELLYKTEVAYAWVEVDQPVDEEGIIESVDHFSRESYPAERAFFGSEWNPGVDNDPRLHILHVTNIGSGIAGYYSSGDQYSQLANPRSNEKEMFYVNLGWLNSSQSFLYYETVLAHEFQHMIHWSKDRNESTWVNEGLSEYAQEVAGYEPNLSFAHDFAEVPDTQLNTWSPTSSSNSRHYGSAYLFIAYFAQRFGPELTRALVAHPANGPGGFNAVLAGAGSDLSFNDIYADWVVANYADDPFALGQEGIYGYNNLDQAPPRLDERYDEYPTVLRKTTVANYGTDYLLLEGEGELDFHFHGNTETRLAALEPASGRYLWWSNRGDDFNTRLTRQFDLRAVAPGTPVEMSAALWWEIEEDYDFAYVSASRDGRTWTILPGDSTVLDEEGNAFGPGYTGISEGWRTEHFDLSQFAGEEIYVRIEYVADDAVNLSGLFVDDIAIPAIGYASDFEQGAEGWESEGWLLTDNQLRQEWIVQWLTLDENRLVGVESVPVDDQGRFSLHIPGLGDGNTAVIAISGAAPVTTEPAAYEYWIDGP